MKFLRAGNAIYSALINSPVSEITRRIYPIESMREGDLPYIAYRRETLSTSNVKTGQSSDTVSIAINCYAATYQDSITLAEAVCQALNGRTWTTDDLRVRYCKLADSIEYRDGDAICQSLTFEIKL